ncbi:Uncharacterised protein [Arthrobacter agilis]|uniref:hypothetical protein n=1 Tax=Arthrobacter agilis TaxID=37921 RepID=UPI000F71E9AA|nr:hypothetical protein [Arthrobacter agilis]VDR31754.1 Uncharacterised protein [Arthrobacter agilis]
MTRAQVRNLEERSALWVAKHLVMAGRLIEIDPEEAFQHALAASRRGGRLAAVREAVGVTAYAAGHYGEALREFRTFRRISGSNVHLPVMADCERGLGRPDRALDLARSEEAETLDAAGKAELAMVVSGARADLGQVEAAVSALEIPQLDLHRAFSFSPRLFRAYADALDAAGRSTESDTWRRQAAVADKALGLDDDLEPDIIDLGEDDDPAPVPVPKVTDLLGRPAPQAATLSSDAASAEVSASAPSDVAPSDVASADVAASPRDGASEADDQADDDLNDPGTEADVMIEADAIGDVSLDLEDDLARHGEGRQPADDEEVAGSAAVRQPEEIRDLETDGHEVTPAASGTEQESDESDGQEPDDRTRPPSTSAAPPEQVSSDASTTPEEGLQTEMLFSMEEFGVTPAGGGGTDETPDGAGDGVGDGGGGHDSDGSADHGTEGPAADGRDA